MFKYAFALLLLLSSVSFANDSIVKIQNIDDIVSKIDKKSWVFINLDKFITGTRGDYALTEGKNLKKFINDRPSEVPVYGITTRGGSHHPQYMSFLKSQGIVLSDLPMTSKGKTLKSDYFKVRDHLIYMDTKPMHPSYMGKTLANIYKQVEKAPKNFVFIGHEFEDAHSALSVQDKKKKISTDVYLIHSNQKTTFKMINKYSEVYPYIEAGDWVFTDVDETLLVFDEETETLRSVDPSSASVVRLMQDKVPVFALTARTANKLPQVLNRISMIDIDFTISQRKLALVNVGPKYFRYPNQSFHNGVIFATRPSYLESAKGPTLRHFLNSIKIPNDLKPKRIVFIDNRLEDIQSVEESDLGVPKLIFHFQFSKAIGEKIEMKETAINLADPSQPHSSQSDGQTSVTSSKPKPSQNDDDIGDEITDEDASSDLN